MTYIKRFFANSRVKSFLWRTGMMIVALVIAQVISILPQLAEYVSPITITVFGLLLGELSKAVNNYLGVK